MVVHDRAILMAEVTALRAENQHQKQKRARPKGTIQRGGSLSIGQGLEMVASRVLAEQFVMEVGNGQAENSSAQPHLSVQHAPRKCSKCNSVGHNVRTCRL